MAHYFEQNGDLVPDPDLELVDLGTDNWLPVAMQHSTGRYCRAAEKAASGNWLIAKGAMADLRSFVRMWPRCFGGAALFPPKARWPSRSAMLCALVDMAHPSAV